MQYVSYMGLRVRQSKSDVELFVPRRSRRRRKKKMASRLRCEDRKGDVEEEMLKWRCERLKVALELECASFEASFSSELLGLMAQEERAVNQAVCRDEAMEACGLVSGRVDAMIEAETFEYFRGRSERDCRKWRAVYARQGADRERLEKGGHSRLGRFEAEEARLRVCASRHWAEAQAYDIERAFNLQLARVDAEWDAYERALRAEFHQEEEVFVSPKGKQRRWHRKEKQARLVHAAPVFEPDAAASAMPKIAISGQADVPQRQHKGKEKDFQRALTRVNFQRENAKKWIRRQAKRMKAQIDATQPLMTMLADEERARLDAEATLLRHKDLATTLVDDSLAKDDNKHRRLLPPATKKALPSSHALAQHRRPQTTRDSCLRRLTDTWDKRNT